MSQESPLSLLTSPDKSVRAQASADLSAAGIAGAESVLPLLSDENWVLRYRACEVIGNAGCIAYASYLIPRLTDEKDHVRYMAVKSLGKLNCRAEIKKIQERLSDENPFVVRITKEVLKAWDE
ncbi:MAG TPA: HEAT repeat domain-containing protein [Methanocorpusculum sp.]|nr:HEAT repeat domain-containing protein [Methanocorpusculum sp.]